MGLRLVAISDQFFNELPEETEFLVNKDNGNRRPYVAVVKLRYQDKRLYFAIPLRSNMQKSVPKNYYISLPPRSTTRQGRKHALQIQKMFPVSRKFFEQYKMDSLYDVKLASSIAKREDEIIDKAVKYIELYSKTNEMPFTPDWDNIIEHFGM